MSFYPDVNARVVGSTVPGGTTAALWAGIRDPLEQVSFLVALNRLDGRQEAALPQPVRIARGAQEQGPRALVSLPAAALDELARGGGSPGNVLTAALRQAVRGYLAALAPRRTARVVGVLNVTPDSFSDGGAFAEPDAAIAHGIAMAADGADWIDVGGESTRPGAAEVPIDEELRRVLPVISTLAHSGIRLSIDTRKSAVAARCFEAGATILNDVSALTHDPRMAPFAAEAGVEVVLMHMPGDPATMQQRATYDDVVADTMQYLRARADAAVAAGIRPEQLWIDPGFGFGKTPEQNLEILRRLREYTSIGLPVLVGTSRKSTIGRVLGGLPAEQRLEGTAATVAAAVLNGADAVRVHDVAPMARVVKMASAIGEAAEREASG